MILNYWERGQNQVSAYRPHRSIPRKKSGVSRSSAVESIADSFLGDITDNQGRIRLGQVRDYFKWRHLEESGGRQVITKCYERWVNCDEYLLFRVWNRITGEKVREFCIKCSKRGNDVYRWRLRKHLEWVEELEPQEFFNPKNRDVRGERTKMLFVNLTYDTKLCSRRKAWENVGEEWNKWITTVRRKFGRVKHLRSFEAFRNGYPHVHAVLVFQDTDFEVSFRDKHNKFRILRSVKDWFDDKWHSHVDVQACYSTGALGYVKKYMLKVHGKKKGVEDVRGVTPEMAIRTLSLLWLFRKQSFSVSGGMRELINDLIGEKHNSNVFPFQTTLEGENLFMFELLGVVTLEELCFSREPPPNANELWSFELPKLPCMEKDERGLSSC